MQKPTSPWTLRLLIHPRLGSLDDLCQALMLIEVSKGDEISKGRLRGLMRILNDPQKHTNTQAIKQKQCRVFGRLPGLLSSCLSCSFREKGRVDEPQKLTVQRTKSGARDAGWCFEKL